MRIYPYLGGREREKYDGLVLWLLDSRVHWRGVVGGQMVWVDAKGCPPIVRVVGGCGEGGLCASGSLIGDREDGPEENA